MTLDYLNEIMNIHTLLHGRGAGDSPSRRRLDEMRKHPRRQELISRALQKEAKRKAQLDPSPSSSCMFCGKFPCSEHK